MVLLAPCIACRHGNHDRHVEIVQAVPEGMMGGHRCPCKGECASRSRPCPCCEGDGCEECSGTGQKVTTHIDAGDGITFRVRGDASLTAEMQDALAALARAAVDQMDSADAPPRTQLPEKETP